MGERPVRVRVEGERNKTKPNPFTFSFGTSIYEEGGGYTPSPNSGPTCLVLLRYVIITTAIAAGFTLSIVYDLFFVDAIIFGV